MDVWVADQAMKDSDTKPHKPRPTPSSNPQGDLAFLAGLPT